MGQADVGAEFVAKGAGYAVLVNPTGVTLRFRGVFQVRLEGANPAARAELLEPFDSFSHYFRGKTWLTDVPNYARLVYHQVYPGIDVSYYGNPSRLEYDFIVAPGADPAAIRMSFAPGEEATVSADGDVIVHTSEGELRQLRPRVYQPSSGGNIEVDGAYVSTGAAEVGVRVEEYDRDKPLIIDPTLTYSSYFGGSAEDSVSAIALDADGNIYVAGWTDSDEFPALNAVESSNQGGVDAFVAKLNPAGTALLYATYLGGLDSDRAAGIAVDSSGCAVITGSTQSPGFPILNAFQETLSGSSDSFVTKLNATGNGLVFSTFLGGSAQASGNAVALDTAGNIYVTGNTNSVNFPTLNAYQAAIHGTQNAFLVKLSPAGNLIYGTYLGGSLTDSGNGVAVDSYGNAYVTGGTTSPNFPVVGGVQTQNAGGQDAFVTKFNAAGTGLVYSTYLGGSGGTVSQPELGNAIAVDNAGNAYVTGETPSTNFPLANAFQAAIDGSLDAFVTELNSSGSALVYSSYLGGSSVDYGNAIAVSSSGAAYIAGYTASTDFPLVAPIQAANAGAYDAFVVEVAPGGASILFSTYLGGENSDAANAIALDTFGNVYLAGQTLSYNFPTAAPLQASNPGGYGGFVAKIQMVVPEAPTVISSTPSSGTGSTQAFTFVFSDPAGFSTISQAQFEIYPVAGTGPQCAGYFNVAANSVYLMNDAQNQWLGPLTLNASGSIQNSQCILNSAGSSVTGSGNNLSLTISFTFQAAFDGAKAISLYANSGSLSSGWVTAATWTVGAVTTQPPTVVTSTPSSGDGTSQTFTFLFSDPAGYATISEAMFDIYSTSGTGPQCLGYYNAAANAVYLMNDAQNAWLGPLALNSTGSAQNSQCTLNSAGSSVTGSGNNLSWVVPLTFEAAFDGTKAISLYAASGSLTSSWVQAATWTVP